MAGCPICGTDGAACLGHGGSQVVRPIDLAITTKEERTVGDLKRYKDAAGHVFSLTAARADMLGGYTLLEESKPAEKAQSPAANKAVIPKANKAVRLPEQKAR